MRRTILLSLALLALAPAPTLAQGTKLLPEAQAHLDAALVAYNAKDYPTAIREFDLAYAIDPRPALLYATAQAHRFAGNCTVALSLYRKYLESKPNETQVEATRVGIASCEDAAKPDPTKPPTPTPTPTPTPVQPPPPTPVAVTPTPMPITDVPATENRPWYTNKLGGALTISGVVGIGVGISFLVMGNSSEQEANDAEFRDDFMRALDEAESRNRIGAIALTAGSALVVGGILVYALGGNDSRPAVVGGIDGRSLYVAGRF